MPTLHSGSNLPPNHLPNLGVTTRKVSSIAARGFVAAGALMLAVVASSAPSSSSLGNSAQGASKDKHAARPKAGSSDLQARLQRLGARFVENGGQWDRQARFMAKSPGIDVWLADDGIVYDYHRGVSGKKKGRTGEVVKMRFPGGRANIAYHPSSRPLTQMDFLHGQREAHVQAYDSVVASQIYPGVDLRAHFDGGKFRYDFVVAPRADYRAIKLAFDGARNVAIRNGQVVLGTTNGPLLHGDLKVFQSVGGRTIPVKAHFAMASDKSVSFRLGEYDRSRPLVIDPLVYGSYYGADAGFDAVTSVVSDPNGGVYMTGWTQDPQFPAIDGPYGYTVQQTDAFVVKLEGDVFAEDYSAIFGGSAVDQGQIIKLDPSGNVWVAGTTNSNDFPGITRTGTVSDIFVIEFKQSSTKVLDPLPTRAFTVSGPKAKTLAGFGIIPIANPVATEPIELVLTGDTSGALNQLPTLTTGTSYLARFDFAPTTGIFTLNSAGSGYISGGQGTEMGGLDVDAGGNAYVAGTVFNQGIVDTSVNPVFVTTPNVYPGGRLLQQDDVFIRKYASNGTLVYSALLGGSSNDIIGGHDNIQTLNDINMGSAIAVDSTGAAYVTGITTSFDFPRTRGVYGETFTSNEVVFVTKIAPNATSIAYSTNIQSIGNVTPSGIAVDARGNAFIAGVIQVPGVLFPEDEGAGPNDPNLPIGIAGQAAAPPYGSSIQVTASALVPTWSSPTPPEMPTTDGWINVLDQTGSNLLYGSYIGGMLDEAVFSPYVDPIGDVWIIGWTDSYRDYFSPGIKNPPMEFTDTNITLPASMLSPDAYKSSPDFIGQEQVQNVAYGAANPAWPFIQPYTPFVTMTYCRSGFVTKIRVNAPTVSSIVLNPATVAGGLGATSSGTVTISQAAPAGGTPITVTVDNAGAASFSPTAPVASMVITIPSGGTTGGFTLYTSSVTKTTPVHVQASYLGAYQIAQLNVVPWLQEVLVSPDSLVGGNPGTGVIVLEQAAPTTGITVTLSSSSSLISFPSGTTVLVPSGQSQASYTFATKGVAANTVVNVIGSFSGASQSTPVTLLPASLVALTFSPTSVAALGKTTGTLTLNGAAGSAIPVTVTVPPGYTVITSAGTSSGTGTVTVPAGATTATFQVGTPIVSSTTVVNVTASMAASSNPNGYQAASVAGSFTVSAVNVSSLTLTPNPVTSGKSVTGTVHLSAVAPASGVIVNLSSSVPGAVSSFPASVTIPAGASTATFSFGTVPAGAQQVITLTAFRGATIATATSKATATLNILPIPLILTVSPTSVLGGVVNATGTVTLPPGVAGANPVTVQLSTTNPAAAAVQTTLTLPAGVSTGTFTITTSSVTSSTSVTISAGAAGQTATAKLNVVPIGVSSVVFTPNLILGGSIATATITLNEPVPVGKTLTIYLSYSNDLFIQTPKTVTFLGGSSSATLRFTTQYVNVPQSMSLTASGPNGGASATGILLVNNY